MFGIVLDFSFTGVLTAAGIVGATGLLIGILLCIAAKKLAVKTDERVEKVRACLPGSNCGGCGFTGCDACAEAIVSGAAPVNACSAGGDAEAIAEILGTEAVASEKKVAFVKCSGTCDKVNFQYKYTGISDCRKLSIVPGAGEKKCLYGCMGYGSCVSVCKFGALSIKDGVAFVDKEKCVGCGACTKVCPNHLIELRPYESWYGVACSSRDKGKDVRLNCASGCIGCGLCTQYCPIDAITITDNVAHIDQSLCVGCGVCEEKCPQGVVKVLW